MLLVFCNEFYIVKLKDFKVNILHFFKHLVLMVYKVCVEKLVSVKEDALENFMKYKRES